MRILQVKNEQVKIEKNIVLNFMIARQTALNLEMGKALIK